jgi:hypothetical protein
MLGRAHSSCPPLNYAPTLILLLTVADDEQVAPRLRDSKAP